MRKYYVSCLLFCVCSASALGAVPNAAPPPACPNPPVPAINSPTVPADVCIPAGFTGNPIQFFDDYSWKAFIAMVWPALTNQRGQPDTTGAVTGKGPRVFETYKALWEIFHNDGSAPAAWNVYDDPTYNACTQKPAFGDMILASFSKYSNLGEAGFGELVGPLVAQNTTYVRYAVGFDQIEFTPILNQKLYISKNIPNPLVFPYGAVDTKSSWILMQGIPNPERYYTRMAYVLDPATNTCSLSQVGLVGLHIVQKTPTRPQWIWSTFEQVDNVPPAAPASPAPAPAPSGSLSRVAPVANAAATYTFNKGDGTAMPNSNPYPINPLKLPTPAPFNVQRLTPINPSTLTTNASYLKLLQANGGVWQYYQLVMTQWPTTPSSPQTPGDPAHTFPGANPTSAFANTTLETFDQTDIDSGCMACHNNVQGEGDFLYTLIDHASPATVPNLIKRSPGFRKLQTYLMQKAAAARLAVPAETVAPAPPATSATKPAEPQR